MNDIRITLFDDNRRMRDALELLIRRTTGFVFGGAFEDCSNVLDDVDATQPEIILMDIDMPGISGIEALKMIRKKFPAIQILMLTSFDDDDKIFNAICAGASGYILKNNKLDYLVSMIREVRDGGAPMSPSIARKVLELFQKSNAPESDEEYNLTAREKDVLSLLVKGLSYKMIADQLNVSYPTVHSHIQNIYHKLHVSSSTEAVAKAIKQRLT